MKKGTKQTRLSDSQRKLVSENIGLVAVHLRRHVANLAEPRRDREWDDLFQEGCLGLAAAAERFRPERGIPFAAFALPRIHNAVSKALQRRFSIVYVPPRRNRNSDEQTSGIGSCGGPAPTPKVVELSEDVERGLTSRGGCSTRGGSSSDTVGQRLRDKYERAVGAAAEVLSAQPSTRGDRAELVRCLVRERLLVPQPEEKRAMRQIARDTRSSYARVAQCEKQLTTLVGQILEADPEYHVLRDISHKEPDGCDFPVDNHVEAQLRTAGTDEFLHRYRGADSGTRAHLLHRVLKLAQARTERILLGCFAKLSNRTRARILQDTAPLVAGVVGLPRTNRRGVRHEAIGATVAESV